MNATATANDDLIQHQHTVYWTGKLKDWTNNNKMRRYANWTFYQCWGGGPAGGYIVSPKGRKVFEINLSGPFAQYTVDAVNATSLRFAPDDETDGQTGTLTIGGVPCDCGEC